MRDTFAGGGGRGLRQRQTILKAGWIQQDIIKKTFMKEKKFFLSKMNMNSGYATTFLAAALLSFATRAEEPMKPMKAGEHQMMLQMKHITTQAQAEALMPGDGMSMTCKKCQSVMIQRVTTNNAHVKMMTVGEKVTCHACDGIAEVVGTGKGEGKDTEVKHVCSKCGDDAMFCSAVKPGSGYLKEMEIKNR
ncbi:MAG TPA: hypothetical protein VMF06_13870 [Candidatus Limnocylindria bacterium]|jgi:RNase P subunit RPR2|nr:hypothetical protein [Candidatus Limnocylindria bacterium]